MTSDRLHLPVMEKEVVDAFKNQRCQPKKILDGTFGRGGHTMSLLANFPDLKIIAFDRDLDAVEYAEKEYSKIILEKRLQVIHGDFRDLGRHNLGPFNGALFDLGVSSPQFDQGARGFSFALDGPLDMRMDRSQSVTAAEIINTSTEKELSDIFFKWGEVRHPNRVVRAIVNDRKSEPFATTRQLASLIERVERAGDAKRKGHQRSERIHRATPYFMALRIAVNRELENLAEFLETLPQNLQGGSRVVVISFHSLEDRIVKWAFRRMDKKHGMIVTKKVMTASDEEVAVNPRARSAKLRIFEIGGPS